MYVIISLIGTADTIMTGTEKLAESNHLEDGEFSLFVPLSDKETEELTDQGITLEEQFYLDYAMEDGSTLRVFQNRKKINIIENEDGTYELAKKVHRGEDGKETEEIAWRVNDISIGLFLDPLSALKAWEKVAFNIYNSAKRAVSDQEAKEKKSN